MSWGPGAGGGSAIHAIGVGGGGYQSSPGHDTAGDSGEPDQEGIEERVLRASETCATHHQFIASQAEYLDRLRSQCATSAQLTQQEIRRLEEKLVMGFSLQLVTKRKLPPGAILPSELQNFPSLKQWLQVVGLSKESVQGMCTQVVTLEGLLKKTEHEQRNIIYENGGDRNEAHKLARALRNLKRYTEVQMKGTESEWCSSEQLPLYWDSWESSCPPSPRRDNHRIQRSSVSSSDGDSGIATSGSTSGGGLGGSGGWIGPDGSRTSGCSSSASSVRGGGPSSQRSSDDSSTPSSPPPPHASALIQSSASSYAENRYTPPPTPPIIKKSSRGSGDRKFPTTPPPGKKYLLNTLQQSPLGRSTSHESQLAYKTDTHEQVTPSMEHLTAHRSGRRDRLHSESEMEVKGNSGRRADGGSSSSSSGQRIDVSPSPSTLASPIKSPYGGPDNDIDDTSLYTKTNTLIVPKSPRTPTLPGSMVHNVQHRFKKMRQMATCGYCQHKVTLLAGGLKCKECSFKCHHECATKVPPSCGLPHELLKIFADSWQKGIDIPFKSTISPSHYQGSGIGYLENFHSIHGIHSNSQPAINIPAFPDSSSNTSSCNSSTPSSPAVIISPAPRTNKLFNFPEVTFDKAHSLHNSMSGMLPMTSTLNYIHKNNSINNTNHNSDVIDSDRTGSGSTGTDDSERTYTGGRVDSQDSTVSDGEVGGGGNGCTRQNSVSSVNQALREWDIPYDELEHGDVLGRGRFGIVHSGKWHGQVAIKELMMDHVDDEKTLEAFKQEVSTFRKTRHENLVLFMGACMKPPRLAIVTSLCKGMTLYKHIHIMKEKFGMSRTIMIAQQISQGMGYLHSRGIVHKDLKTKNIFLENGKVVITDFGLFNVTQLCNDQRRAAWLTIPPGWLCYLSPEIMRNLRVSKHHLNHQLPFTTQSDVYSFGTVWYELLCGEWPHRGLVPEAVIWQVGRGMKPSLANLQASRDVKDILLSCWNYVPDDRPELSSMSSHLTRLPKKRLHRSPSHPIHLSRSAESVF